VRSRKPARYRARSRLSALGACGAEAERHVTSNALPRARGARYACRVGCAALALKPLPTAFTAAKTRVWDFLLVAENLVGANDAEACETHQETLGASCTYASGSCIWLSRDPIGLAGGLNLYGYVNGDPIKYRDPSGLYAYDGGDSPGTPSPGSGGGGVLRDLACMLGLCANAPYRQPQQPIDCNKVWHTAYDACVARGGGWETCLAAADKAYQDCEDGKTNGASEGCGSPLRVPGPGAVPLPPPAAQPLPGSPPPSFPDLPVLVP
jgi:RHS repeat-associated protein